MALRVYQLAKQLKITSKQLLSLLRGHNFDVASHMSNISSDQVALARKHFASAERNPKRPVAGQQEVSARRLRDRPARAEQNASTEAPNETKKTPSSDGPTKGTASSSANKQNVSEPITPTPAPVKEVRPPVRTVPLDRIFGPGKGRRPLPAHGLGGRQLTGARRRTGAGRPQGRSGSYRENSPSGSSRPGHPPSTARKENASVAPTPESTGRRSDDARKGPKMERRRVTRTPNRRRRPQLGAPGAQGRSGRKKMKRKKQQADREKVVQVAPELPSIQVPDVVSVKEFAELVGSGVGKVIGELLKMGQMMTANQTLTPDLAAKVGQRLGCEVKVQTGRSDFAEELLASEDTENLKPRPPVITVMGHVDHGKTSLLDAIRATDVASSEAGGITQHIGASVIRHGEQRVVFLDTPGHEAFTTMRSRGAEVTDIVVLVVAADDGVMPQTIEAIDHAKSAKVPMLVAINKIDKPGADPQRVKTELSNHGLQPEEWGGDTIFCEVSAKEKTGLDNTLDMILLLSEMQELKVNPDQKAHGSVIEAELDKGRGPVATVLVQKGTLRVGDAFVVGSIAGKVRAMINDKGDRVKEAGPSMPVEVLGLPTVPAAGDLFHVVDDEREAKEISQRRQIEQKRVMLASQGTRMKLEDLFSLIKKGGVKELNIILKADVQGSVEAISDSIEKLSTEQVKIQIIHKSVGTVNESDVLLATTSDSIVVGYNVVPEPRIRKLAEKQEVEIRLYTIIYELLDEIRAAMEGLLDPVTREEELGRAEVRQTFSVPKVGTIAGCYVTDGKVARNAMARLLREGKILWTGKVSSLKRFKDDAREVARGFECGIGLEGYNDIKVGDVIQFFTIVKEKASLDKA